MCSHTSQALFVEKMNMVQSVMRAADGDFPMTTFANEMVETSILSDIGQTFQALAA